MVRAPAWLAVSPVIATGVLVSHALAYRLTGTESGSLHAYLGHAPQVLLVLVLLGVAMAGLGARGRLARWPFPALALAAFVVQEHVERLAHTGELHTVLTSPAFVVGLLLQVPVALAAWLLARWLVQALEEPLVLPPRPTFAALVLRVPAAPAVAARLVHTRAARGPPALSVP